MMSHRILAAALLLCTLAAACGELPTTSHTQAQPAAASYDGGGFGVGSGNNAVQSGGYGMGSGNTADEDDGYTIGSGNSGAGTVDTPPSTPSTASGDSVGRGGYGMGSGN
jgi:hypothetical protein